MIHIAYWCKWNGYAPTKSGALYTYAQYLYNNNYNNNYSFVILICLQPFCQPHLFVRSSQRRILNRNFTQGWLNYYWLVACFVFAFFKRTSSVCRMLSRRFVFSPSRELYCNRLHMCILIRLCVLCIIFNALFVSLSRIKIPTAFYMHMLSCLV